MSLYFEDGDNVRTNSVTITTRQLANGYAGPLYNAVLKVDFANEVGDADYFPLEEFRNYAKVDVPDNDEQIPMFITAARQMLETYGNISLIERTITALLQTPNGYYRLPYTPLGYIMQVRDVDGNDLDYTSNAQGVKVNATVYEVQYTAGYSKSALPEKFKKAVFAQALYLYDNRDATDIVSVAKMAIMPHRFV